MARTNTSLEGLTVLKLAQANRKVMLIGEVKAATVYATQIVHYRPPRHYHTPCVAEPSGHALDRRRTVT
jgi:hypothetical protein